MSDFLQFVDRVPTLPNRKKITHADSSVEYATIEYADEPIETGTALNKVNLEPLTLTLGYNTPNIIDVPTYSLYDKDNIWLSTTNYSISNFIKIENKYYMCHSDKIGIYDLNYNLLEQVNLTSSMKGYDTGITQVDDNTIFIASRGTGSNTYDYYCTYKISNKTSTTRTSVRGQYWYGITSTKIGDTTYLFNKYSNSSSHIYAGENGALVDKGSTDAYGAESGMNGKIINNKIYNINDAGTQYYLYIYSIDTQRGKYVREILSSNAMSYRDRRAIQAKDIYILDEYIYSYICHSGTKSELRRIKISDITESDTYLDDGELIETKNDNKSWIRILYIKENGDYAIIANASSMYDYTTYILSKENGELLDYQINTGGTTGPKTFGGPNLNIDSYNFLSITIDSNGGAVTLKRIYNRDKYLTIQDLALINNISIKIYIPSDYIVTSLSKNYLNNKLIDTLLVKDKYYELVYNESQEKWIAEEVRNAN